MIRGTTKQTNIWLTRYEQWNQAENKWKEIVSRQGMWVELSEGEYRFAAIGVVIVPGSKMELTGDALISRLASR